MLALYIIAGILLFLFLLTLLNIRVYAVYENELKLSLRIGFVKIRLMPPKKKKKKKKKKAPVKTKPQKTKPSEKKKSSFDFKALYKEEGVSGILNIVKRIADLAVGTLKDFFSHVTVSKLRLEIKVAGSDAADSAIKYGRVCAALFPALGIISRIVKVKKREISVSPDFSDDPKGCAKAYVVAKIRILSLLCIAIKRGIQALKLLLSLKQKNENKKEIKK